MSAHQRTVGQRARLLVLALLASVGLVVLGPATPAHADPACLTGGVYVLWARGTNSALWHQENADPYETKAFHDHVFYALVAAGIASNKMAWAELGNLDPDYILATDEYPASVDYGNSVAKGTDELVKHLNDRYDGDGPTGGGSCTSEVVVLGGYSQGADVIGWALERTGYGALSQTAKDHIGFVAFYGDPKNYSNGGQVNGCYTPPWYRGDVLCHAQPAGGTFGARNPYLPSGFSYRVGSWCNEQDGFCNNYHTLPGNHETAYRDSANGGQDWIHQSAAEVAAMARAKMCVFNSCTNVASHSDVDKEADADLFLMTDEGANGSKGFALLSNYNYFVPPAQWWNGVGYGWSGVTPFVGDVTGDKRADLIFLTNEGANGTKVFVATANSTGTGFNTPQMWYNATGWGYTGIKPVVGDVNGDTCDDLVVVTNEGAYGSKGFVLRSSCSGFYAPELWWNGAGYGWSGVTPLVGDVMNGDFKADLVYLTNEGANGTKAFVATSTGSLASGGFGTGQLKWTGTGMMYAGIKPALGDVDGNGCTDLVITTDQGASGSNGYVLLATCAAFLSPALWWTGTGYSWSGITPLVGDVTGDKKADYVVLTNEGANGTKAYVATPNSNNNGFNTPALWWTGTGLMYSGIKPYLK